MEDAADYGSSVGAKRRRDEPEEAPEAKRICAADLILLDMLEDAEPADGDLASVMRSLEEEIASFSPPPGNWQPLEDGGVSTSEEDLRGSDLGYLLEASDDDLGLPPTVPSSSEEEDVAEGDLGEVGTQGTDSLGQIWRMEDEIQGCYDALEFGGEFVQVGGGDDDGLVIVGGLFDYADAASLAEFSLHPESLPTV